jgi:short-subunit dehydrogenase
MDLDDKLILLTGAAGGIGEAIAHRLAGSGARMLLVGRSPARLAAVCASLPRRSRPHLIVPADITTPQGRAAICAALSSQPQALDALINAAGVSTFSWLAETASADIEAMLATNIVAPILLTQLALPFLERTNGRIVLIGSSFGGIGYPGFASYCASKFGLRGFTEALRRELGDSAIQVACLAPRATQTPLNSAAVCAMNAALGNRTDPPERVAETVEEMLLARRMRDRAIGWPERLFLRLNAIFPGLVDGALRKQLTTIKGFARVNKAARDPASGATKPTQSGAVQQARANSPS